MINYRTALAKYALALSLVLLAKAPAQADDAMKILKSMTDYVASQKSFSASFDSDIEVLTPEMQKIQFASSGQLILARPDKLRATRTGGYADVEFVYDGKMITAYGKNLNVFAQADASGSIDKLIDRMRSEFGVEAPGADLLLANSFDELSAGVIDAKHIGLGVVDGVECEHLAFRDEDTDWQLWVETGPRPIPHKYVITTKGVTGGPQYTLRIKDWKSDVQVGPETFAFKPAAGAQKVDIKALAGIDEVPPGSVMGAKQ
jgi:hypothetical protein